MRYLITLLLLLSLVALGLFWACGSGSGDSDRTEGEEDEDDISGGGEDDDDSENDEPCIPGDFTGETITDDRNYTWVRIPAGCFTMGSPPDEPGRNSDEQRHRVDLTRDYLIMTTEVSRGLFEEIMGYVPYSYNWDAGPDHAVETLTWYEALAFSNRLSEEDGLPPCFNMEDILCKDGSSGDMTTYCDYGEGVQEATITLNGVDTLYDCKGYRPPTEAEWEQAARAGTETAFYGGEITKPRECNDPVLDEIGWYECNATYAAEMAMKEPNDWGLYDMAGNVHEWLWDRWDKWSSKRLEDPEGPGGIGPEVQRIDRGGAVNRNARGCRSANRDRYAADNNWSSIFGELPNIGFRPARTY